MLLLLACSTPPAVSSDLLSSVDPEGVLDGGDPDPGPDTPVDTGDDAPVDQAAPRLLFNEVMTDNRSTLQVSGRLADWIELYNADSVAVPLSRVTVWDQTDHVWMGREGEIAPGERKLLYADGAQGEDHLPFSLDSDGDELTLAVAGAVTDRIATGELGGDIAWARVPDGGEWAPTADSTPGSANPDSAGDDFDLTDEVFHTDYVHEIKIQLDSDAYTTLYSNRLSWVEGSVELDGISYTGVGVRSKAYVGSARTLDQKCGWKIDMNRYNDFEWRGLKKITLNNMVQDYTYVHEYMAYTLFRAAGVPAPRVGYAWVTMNGTEYGLYLVIESIDQSFMEQWWTDTTGTLYEGAYGVDVQSDEIMSFDYDQGPDSTDRSDLYAVSAILDGDATDAAIDALDELVDMDEFLSNMAVEAVALHWDGYTTANNYRLYHDPVTDKFQIIPWGSDQTFTTQYYGPWSMGGRIFQFCIDNRGCLERYDDRLEEVTYLMDDLELNELADDLHTLLWPYINDDPRREFSIDTHTYYYDYSQAVIDSYPQSVRDQLVNYP